MSNKLMLVLIGVLFVLVLAMGGGMFMIWNKLAAGTPAARPEGEKGSEKPKVEEMGKIQSLDTFVVNLSDPGGNRYLRVTMDLEVTGGKPAEDEVVRRIPQMRDAILMILPSKRFADINSTEGKTAVREELHNALNGLMTTGKIARIYFKEFVIQ
jgi:flagellar FliL protein